MKLSSLTPIDGQPGLYTDGTNTIEMVSVMRPVDSGAPPAAPAAAAAAPPAPPAPPAPKPEPEPPPAAALDPFTAARQRVAASTARPTALPTPAELAAMDPFTRAAFRVNNPSFYQQKEK